MQAYSQTGFYHQPAYRSGAYPPQCNHLPLPAPPLQPSCSGAGTTANSRQRTQWGTTETYILLEMWGAKYRSLKLASATTKRDIWSEIRTEFIEACRDQNLAEPKKSVAQIKKWISNLEIEYKKIKTKMAKTGEEGAKRLQEECVFFVALDEVMGTRDTNNPELMHIRDTAILPKRKVKELFVNPQSESAVSDDEAEDELRLYSDSYSNYSSVSEFDEEMNVEENEMEEGLQEADKPEIER